MSTPTPKQVVRKVAEAGVFFSTFLPVTALAATSTGNCDPTTGNIADGAKCSQAAQSQPNNLFGPDGVFQQISNILIFLVGAISVIMLIFGGLRYVISSGEKGAVEGAKNTILYAVIGIVVAILAYAIVGFVTDSLTQNVGSTTP